MKNEKKPTKRPTWIVFLASFGVGLGISVLIQLLFNVLL